MGIQANTNTIIYTKDSGETNPIEFYAATQDDLFINDVGYRVGTYYWVQKGNSPCETFEPKGYPTSLSDDAKLAFLQPIVDANTVPDATSIM